MLGTVVEAHTSIGNLIGGLYSKRSRTGTARRIKHQPTVTFDKLLAKANNLALGNIL